jgi:hypothetical protein
MKLKNIDRKEQIEDVVEKILTTKKYGDVISYKELEQLIGYEREDLGFTVVLGCAKELLVEYGYVLKSIINEGCKILYPNEIAEEVIQRHLKQSTNKLNKALRIMQYADRDMLNKEELAFFERVENLIGKTFNYNENMLFEAQALLNEVKMQELAE